MTDPALIIYRLISSCHPNYTDLSRSLDSFSSWPVCRDHDHPCSARGRRAREFER